MTQRSHPSGTDQPSTTQLVRAFFTEAPEAFRPLVSGPGSRWTTRLRHLTQNGFELTTAERIEGVFSADCEFQTPELSGEITFGDREYFINTVVSPRGRTHRYGLWEWADALDRPDLVPRATDFVLQLDRLHEIVRGMAGGLLELGPAIARAERPTLQRMDAARAEVQASHDRRLREADHRGAVARANDAFRQQRWDRVIELLESLRIDCRSRSRRSLPTREGVCEKLLRPARSDGQGADARADLAHLGALVVVAGVRLRDRTG